PSRSVLVSWSESNDSATQARAPFFQHAGFSERPARTLFTAARHPGSAQVQARCAAPFPARGRMTNDDDEADWRAMVSSFSAARRTIARGARSAQRASALALERL